MDKHLQTIRRVVALMIGWIIVLMLFQIATAERIQTLQIGCQQQGYAHQEEACAQLKSKLDDIVLPNLNSFEW